MRAVITRLSWRDFLTYLKAIDPKFDIRLMSDRIVVLYDGKEAEVFYYDELNTEAVKHCEKVAYVYRNSTIKQIFHEAVKCGESRRARLREAINDVWKDKKRDALRYVAYGRTSVYIRRKQ